MGKDKIIKCPMKVIEIFPYGKVLVADIDKLKEELDSRKN